MSPRRTLLVLALGGVLALSASSPAQAKSRFPELIWDFFCQGPNAFAPSAPICQSQTYPPCRLCHIQSTTGAGTIQTPFGLSMLAHGLSGDDASVAMALKALAADNVDSDGDGVTDIDELENNSDPNTPAKVGWSNEPTPSYGCAVAGGRARHGPGPSLTALALLFCLVARRRP